MGSRLRRLSPRTKDVLWRLAGAVDPAQRTLFRLWTRDRRPVPPLRVRAHVGPFFRPRPYLESGAQVLDDLEGVLEQFGAPLGSARDVLDLACGAGRISMHVLERHPGVALTGCDVDRTSIAWAERNLPRGRFLDTRPTPPLPLQDETFDLIFSYSLWTHLPEPDQMAWLAEVGRLLRPSGLAVVTTHGVGAHSWFKGSPDAFVQSDAFMRRLREGGRLDERGFLFFPYEAAVSGHGLRDIAGEYGMSFQTPEHTRRRWSDLVEVLGVLPDAIAHQDAVVVRRRDVPGAGDGIVG